MRFLVFSKRCAKEILRDPLNLAFGLGFPIALLLLLSAIQANIPIDLFKIESLAPGVSIFSLSFITLFSATLISRDRESSFMERLYTTPMKPIDFILGYILSILPIAIMECVVSYLVSIFLGLSFSINILVALLLTLPIAVLYIALGLLFGSVLNVKQVGGICGALLTNLSAWLSGVWFDISLIGGAFKKIAELLPFYHSVELVRAAVIGDFLGALNHLAVPLVYTVLILALAIKFFLRGMKKG